MSAQVATGMFNNLPEKTKNILIISVVLIIIIAIVVGVKGLAGFIGSVGNGVNGILEAFGLKADEEQKKINADLAAVDAKATSSVSPFNPKYYKTVPAGTSIFPQATADKLADQVYDSVGNIWDDPEAGLAAVKQATNWAQVSQIADALQRMYAKDMYSWLKIKYDTKAQKDILVKMVNYAFNLPKY